MYVNTLVSPYEAETRQKQILHEKNKITGKTTDYEYVQIIKTINMLLAEIEDIENQKIFALHSQG